MLLEPQKKKRCTCFLLIVNCFDLSSFLTFSYLGSVTQPDVYVFHCSLFPTGKRSREKGGRRALTTRTVTRWRSSRSGTAALVAGMEKVEANPSLLKNVSLFLFILAVRLDPECNEIMRLLRYKEHGLV